MFVGKNGDGLFFKILPKSFLVIANLNKMDANKLKHANLVFSCTDINLKKGELHIKLSNKHIKKKYMKELE